jgi:hypothetical protein
MRPDAKLDRFIHSLKLYAEHGCEPGSFLRAVLENDLRESIARADTEAAAALPAIVRYIYSEFPMGIWGSRENVREHLVSFWRAEG